MRLIDADALNDYVMDVWGGGNADNTVIWYGDVLNAINDAPTIDPESLRAHGKWTTQRTMAHDGEWWCTNCGHEPTVFEGQNYCPRCGAKMDLEDKPCGE